MRDSAGSFLASAITWIVDGEQYLHAGEEGVDDPEWSPVAGEEGVDDPEWLPVEYDFWWPSHRLVVSQCWVPCSSAVLHVHAVTGAS